MASDDKSNSGGEAVLAYITLTLIVLIAFIPALLGFLGFWFTRTRLKRSHYAIALVVGIVLSVVSFTVSEPARYIMWLVSFFGLNDASPLQFPVLALIAYPLTFFGLFGVVGVSLLGKLHPSISKIAEKASPVDIDPSRAAQITQKTRSSSIATPAQIASVSAKKATDADDPDNKYIVLGLGPAAAGRSSMEEIKIYAGDIKTHGIILGTTGTGKALALDTPIPTPSGWTTMGELNVGDTVFAPDGSPTRVVFVTPTQVDHECYRVSFSDGTSIIADADHRWLTLARHPHLESSEMTSAVVSTKDILGSLHTDEGYNHILPDTQPLQYAVRKLPADPYVVGRHMVGSVTDTVSSPPPLPHAAADLQPYLLASIPQRVALLRGAFDVAGAQVAPYGDLLMWLNPASLRSGFTPDSLVELISSLGGYITATNTTSAGTVEYHFALPPSVYIELTGADYASAKRHAAHLHRPRTIVDVEPVPSVPVRCIQVDSRDHLYLAGPAAIPTHNTETLKRLIGGLLDLDWSGCVLDLKEDIGEGGLAHFLEAYAASAGVEYQHWALSYTEPEFDFYLNPLQGLNMDRAKNMIISMQDFEAPHWEMLCKQVLGQLLDLMYMSHEVAPDKFPEPSLRDVGKYLADDLHDGTQQMRAVALAALAPTGQRTKQDYAVLSNPSRDHVTASKGLGARISAAYESSAGRTGLRRGNGRRVLRLSDPGLVYIGLDQLGQPDTSRVVSSSILAGYSALASVRKDDSRVKAKLDRRFLVVDEAASVNPLMVKNLLSRARSAGIAVILATQGAVDWGDEWNEMVNNTNFSVIMGQQDVESATLAADLIGKQYRTDESLAVQDGMVVRSNLREIEDYRVNPERLRMLPQGQAYLRVRDRQDSDEPYLTFVAIKLRQSESTASTHLTSVERRVNQGTKSAPFEHALPSFDNVKPLEPIQFPDPDPASTPAAPPWTTQPQGVPLDPAPADSPIPPPPAPRQRSTSAQYPPASPGPVPIPPPQATPPPPGNNDTGHPPSPTASPEPPAADGWESI